MRGVAALSVLIYHAVYSVGPSEKSPFPWLMKFFAYHGWTGVYLFFVISGFCIHLRRVKAQAAGESAAIDFRAFWWRRFRRLYPAYLAALILAMAVRYSRGELPMNAFTGWNVGLHLTLLHNLDFRTTYLLNGAFWTLAVEEQLYLAYFLLIWLRDRFGWRKTLAVCFLARVVIQGISLALWKFFHYDIALTEAAAATWIVWALGAVSVEAHYGLIRLPRWCYSPFVAAAAFGAAASITYVYHYILKYGHAGDLMWLLNQPLWGGVFFLWLNCAVSRETRAPLARQRPLVRYPVAIFAALGVVSYSLYLTHAMIFLVFVPSWFSVALSLAFAVVFFRAFEKPFLSPSSVHAHLTGA